MALSGAERVALHRAKQLRYVESDGLARLLAADESGRRRDSVSQAAERVVRAVRYHRWLADGKP